jgi:hypothetical protein
MYRGIAMTKRVGIILVASIALAAFVGADDGATASDVGISVEGYIYGTVETKDGKTHTGVLRWDDEEAFWDDLFHSSKDNLPYEEYAEEPDADEEATWWERMANTISGDLNLHHVSRSVAVRFGDLKQIRVTGGDDAVLTLRDGTEIEVSGYANDVGATVVVFDAKPGQIEVPWKKIDTINFSATPPDADPGSFRLRGTVSTTEGEFVGSIQWDNEESLSTDRLDGDTDDDDVSLAMGDIRSIERRDRRSSRVVLKDGTEMVLSGTNDVNDDIRGIHVEDARFGRVEIDWDEFSGVVFDEPGTSGATYEDYAVPTQLAGTVTLENGDWRTGRLVFDLDEEWSWEMLDGSSNEIDYTVPFSMVASIEPAGGAGSLVRLRNGIELQLEDSHDVDRDNSGVLVIPNGSGKPGYVPWRDIAKIKFD